jgi:ATP phosphoribosyltransferase regulatory subunit
MAADPYASLRALFADAGYVFVEPPILHDASVFVEVAGEDLRRRMFLTTDAGGRELALRPEYTVPVCLHHLATGPADRRADYGYVGRVFRQRTSGRSEFLQAGVESLGRADAPEADADVLALAFAAANELEMTGAKVTIGDTQLFAAVVGALDLGAPWRLRLRRAFGDRSRLRSLLASARGTSRAKAVRSNVAMLRDQVTEMLSETGLAVIGARTADEIAERFLDKEMLAEGISDHAVAALEEFLAIAGPPSPALAELRAFAQHTRLAITAIDQFARRTEALARHGIEVDRLTFAADFGRRLDYYTGFVFEFRRGDSRTSGAAIGGGRYDGLMAIIDPGRPAGSLVPAVGFAISLDRVGYP